MAKNLTYALKVTAFVSALLFLSGCAQITENLNHSTDVRTQKNNQGTGELYLKISNSGIVCITTPCPYYKAEILNSADGFNVDEISFAQTHLNTQQEEQARQLMSRDGLLVTGTTYASQGKTGKGIGISVTKVFLHSPAAQ